MINKNDNNNIVATYYKGTAQAAPIITDTGFNLRIGDSYTLQNTKYLNSTITDADLQGANRVWDASNLIDSGNSNIVSIYSSKGLPRADSFPASNIAVGNNPFETISFLETTPSKSGWVGTYTYDGSINKRHIERDNPSSPWMVYPMTFLQSYNDWTVNYNSWLDSGNFKSQFDTINESLSGIGYGTLKLPNATYNNVLCVKKRDKYHLDYSFFTNGIHIPLLHLTNDYNTKFDNNIVYTNWKATYYKGVALPVQIVSFSTTLQNKTPYLQWNAANTLNTKTFNIQRSLDGITFSTIGQVPVSSSSSYHFADSYTPANIVYYRLQQVDKDGQIFYSKTCKLAIDNFKFSINPNPAKDFATISFSKMIDKATIAVYDMTGKQVIWQTVTGSVNMYKLNTQSLKSGIYEVKINTASGSINEKLLITK